MSADASPPHASGLLFDQPKTSAAALLDALSSGGFRASAPAPIPSSKTSLGSIPKAQEIAPISDGLGSIPKNSVKPAESKGNSGKLQVSKARGQQESFTVTADAAHTFRIRLTESGYAVVLRWKESDGKRPERYLCYLSKTEWKKAQRGSLSAFVALVLAKLDERKATEKGDADKLDALAVRVRAVGK